MSGTKLDYLGNLNAVGLTAAEFRVLVKLTLHSDKEGRDAFPARATLATESEVSERYVIDVVHSLLAKGAIRLARKGGNAVHRGWANAYDVDFDWPAVAAAREAARAEAAEAAKSDLSYGRVNHRSPSRVNHSSEKGDPQFTPSGNRSGPSYPVLEKSTPPLLETQSGRQPDDEKIFSEKRRDEAVDGAEPLAEDSSSSSRQMVAAEARSTSRAREAEPVPDHATELELLNLLVFYRPDFRNLPNPGEHGPQVSTAWAKARECRTADGLTAELTAMAVVDSSRSLLEALTDLCCDVEVTEGGTGDGEQFARGSVEREA